MTKESDNTTRAIACRVSMPEYIRILTEASNKGIGVSEWLLMKIYVTEKAKTPQVAANASAEARLSKEIQVLSSAEARLSKEIQVLSSEKARLSKEIQVLSSEKEKYRIEAERLGNINTLQSEELKDSNQRGDMLEEENNAFKATNEKIMSAVRSVTSEIEYGDPNMGHERVKKIVRSLDRL